MANYFIDLSAATNGTGTAVDPYNVITTAMLVPGNTYWLRRSEPATVSTLTIVVPSNVMLIGWPKVGDKFYDTRPSVPTWDADTADYCTVKYRGLQGPIHILSVHDVYLSRLKVVLYYDGTTAWYQAIRIYTCNRVYVDNCYIMRNSVEIATNTASYAMIYVESSIYVSVTNTIILRKGSRFNSACNKYFMVYLSSHVHADIELLTNSDSTETGVAVTESSNPINAYEIYLNSSSNCVVNILYNFTHQQVLTYGAYIGLTRSKVSISYKSTVDVSEFAYGLMVPSAGMEYSTVTIDLPAFTGIKLDDYGTNDITIITSKVLGNFSSYNGAVHLTYGGSLKLLAKTPTGIAFPLNTKTTRLYTAGTNEIYVSKTSEDITAQIAVADVAVIHHYDQNDVYRVLTPVATARSTTVARTGGATSSIEVTSTTVNPTQFGKIGTDLYSPFTISLTAGSYTVRFYIAGYGALTRLRYGMIFLKGTWIDARGKDLVVSDEIVYTNDQTWTGITGYAQGYLEVPVTVDRTTEVKLMFEVSYSTEQLLNIYIDPVAVVSSV